MGNFNIQDLDLSNVVLDQNVMNSLTIKELKEAYKFFPDLKLSNSSSEADQLEFIQITLWANFKDQGMTLADTENLPFSVIIELTENMEEEAVIDEAPIEETPDGLEEVVTPTALVE